MEGIRPLRMACHSMNLHTVQAQASVHDHHLGSINPSRAVRLMRGSGLPLLPWLAHYNPILASR